MTSLTSLSQLNPKDMIEIIDAADNLADKIEAGDRRFDVLAGNLVTTAFFEPSTRTRLSFEAAAKLLGADVLTFDPATSSAVKGESLEDTARTLTAIGTDILVVRHSLDDGPARMAAVAGIPVVSGGAGRAEHPTQTLLDLLTMRRQFGRIEGLRVGVVGDIRNSRVAAGLLYALPALGAKVVLAGPTTMVPVDLSFPVVVDLNAMLPEVDVAYFLRIQTERGSETGYDTSDGYRADFGMDEDRLQKLQPQAVIMHPGPMNRGVEISDAVADSPRCLATTQVRLGVPTRMAVLMRCLGES